MILKNYDLFMDICERIRECRKEKNLSQASLAKAINVSPGAVGQWETNPMVEIKAKNLLSMARVFNVSPSWLEFGIGKKEGNKADALDTSEISQELLESCILKINDALFWLDREIPPAIKAKMIAKLYMFGGVASPEDVRSIVYSVYDKSENGHP